MRTSVLLASLWLACDPSATPSAPASATPSAPASATPTAAPPSPSPSLLGGTPGVLEHLEVDALGPEHRGRTVRVHGWVAPGSIAHRAEPSTTRFVLVRGDGSLTVELTGPVPDRFQERLEAIVTGTLSEDGARLLADDLVAKCPDDYATLPAWPESGGPR